MDYNARMNGYIESAGGGSGRMYSPVLGRFIQPDPIVPDPLDPQSLNRFSYVRNSPLNRIDPNGHFDIDPQRNSLCRWVPFLCQPPANPGMSGALYVAPAEAPISPIGVVAAKGSGQNNGGLIARLFGIIAGAATSPSGPVNQACRDGDCFDEVNEVVGQLRKSAGIGPSQNLGAAMVELGDDVSTFVVGSAHRVSDGFQRLGFKYINPQARAHSESMLLENIAAKLADSPAARGTVRLFTYLSSCDTCKDVIRQFQEKFPNVRVVIYYLEEFGGAK
jgi:hypothetical protein